MPLSSSSYNLDETTEVRSNGEVSRPETSYSSKC